jgi:hypothetical protein
VLDDFGGEEEGGSKWHGEALATDEAIYSFPFFAQHILAIDPFKELTMIMQNNIIKYPEELDWLFAKDGGCNETFFLELRKVSLNRRSLPLYNSHGVDV